VFRRSICIDGQERSTAQHASHALNPSFPKRSNNVFTGIPVLQSHKQKLLGSQYFRPRGKLGSWLPSASPRPLSTATNQLDSAKPDSTKPETTKRDQINWANTKRLVALASDEKQNLAIAMVSLALSSATSLVLPAAIGKVRYISYKQHDF